MRGSGSWKRRTTRAQKMNFAKFRLSGTRNTFANISDNMDLPVELRNKAERLVAEVVIMLEMFPKHLPK